MYAHCDPSLTNPAIGSTPTHVIVAGERDAIYDYKNSPACLSSDFRLVIKSKNGTAKVRYYQSFKGLRLVRQDRYGKPLGSTLGPGRVLKADLFRNGKAKLRNSLRLTPEGQYEILVEEDEGGKRISLI